MTVLTLNYPCSQCLLDNGDMIKAEKTEKRALSVDEFTLKLELYHLVVITHKSAYIIYAFDNVLVCYQNV